MTLPENLRKRTSALYRWRGWSPIGAIGDALSGITSIGLVVIAWYTVIPLYQNAMLEEKNAQLERELDDKKKSLSEVGQKLEDTRNHVNLTENNLLQAKTDLSNTRRENQELQRYNSELIKGINTQRLEQKDLTRIIDDLYHERRDLQSEITQLKAEKEKGDEAIIRYETQTKEYGINQFIQKVKGKLAPTPSDNILALEMHVETVKAFMAELDTPITRQEKLPDQKETMITLFESLEKLEEENSGVTRIIEDGLNSMEFKLLKWEERENIHNKVRKFILEHERLFNIKITPKIIDARNLSETEFSEKLKEELARINKVRYQFMGTLDKLAEYLRAD